MTLLVAGHTAGPQLIMCYLHRDSMQNDKQKKVDSVARGTEKAAFKFLQPLKVVSTNLINTPADAEVSQHLRACTLLSF